MLQKWRRYTVIMISVLMLCLPMFSIDAEAARHIVVIDPAHGGREPGVLGVDKVAEKDLTLAIALELKQELSRDANLEVILTRDSDETVALEDRQKDIQKRNPALVLSLHINAGFGKSSSGYELYYPGFKEAAFSGKDSKKDSPGKQYLNDTVKLARIVQRNLDGLFPRKGRGLREAPVPLAEGVTVPVLIVELGFATNPDEKKKLESGKTQKDIARVLAKSIRSFF